MPSGSTVADQLAAKSAPGGGFLAQKLCQEPLLTSSGQRKLRQEPLQGSLLENYRCQILPEFSCFFSQFVWKKSKAETNFLARILAEKEPENLQTSLLDNARTPKFWRSRSSFGCDQSTKTLEGRLLDDSAHQLLSKYSISFVSS